MSPLQICQSDYSRDLLEWIEPDNLPDWLGGRSKGTLLDDVGPWSDPEVLRRIEGQSAVAAKALKRMSSAVPAVSGTEGPTQLVVLDELADGYHSPRYDPMGDAVVTWRGCMRAGTGCCRSRARGALLLCLAASQHGRYVLTLCCFACCGSGLCACACVIVQV